MSDKTELPKEISTDGSEVWGWANKMSDHVHRLDRIRKLNARILVIGWHCGDCAKWMKSSLCPKEHNVNGRTRGPSCGDFKCPSFVEGRSATKLRDDLNAELAREKTPAKEPA